MVMVEDETTWSSLAQIAAGFGVKVERAAAAMRLIGLHESRVHARGEGLEVELSEGAATLVRRELQSRGAARA